MRMALGFLAAVIGAGLMLRGVADWGAGFLAVAAALAIWRARLTPFARIEAALVAALLISCMAATADGALAALVILAAFELMRVM
jgi:hypothetical protein